MKRKQLIFLAAAVCMAFLAACGTAQKKAAETTGAVGTAPEAALQDGTYQADFVTDSDMFHVNEAYDGKGTLTVKDGGMTIHITLPSENIVNLFPGTAEDAQKDGAELLSPTKDTVTCKDGTTEVCNGFDVPVPALDTEFDLAILGTKGKWYDHKVSVSNPVAAEAASSEDQAAADHVAALIDAIYVKERTDQTDEQCREAKEAWDALTDTQKALVHGESADPEYFGRDTGDASKDDPLNEDGIGEKEILAVSFGTSFNDSRAKDIGGIEKALAAAYPDYSVRRAFTSQIILNHIEARDGEICDNVDQALARAEANGVKQLVVQPTHLMHGAEYDELVASVKAHEDKFESVVFSEPLLGETGTDNAAVNGDKKAVAEAVTAQAFEKAGWSSREDAQKDGAALVLMGHGTSHQAAVTYDQMQAQMNDLGYDNVFVGTVEGKPADTACKEVIRKVHEAGYKQVILRPLMVVAGDHANNDMAGDDEDSWKSQFESSGYFGRVNCQIEGLGELPGIQAIYVQHLSNAVGQEPAADAASTEGVSIQSLAPADGSYLLDVTLEGGSGKASVQSPCRVTVKDGKAEACLIWSSPYYDYMLVGGTKYENESVKGNSSFTIPVETFDAPVSVTADTTAMSAPHEIDYTLTFAWPK